MSNNSIIDKLEIFIITYNRAAKLENTLKQLFDKDSPVKDFSITVIDNNSTDNTASVVEKYQSIKPNLLYEKNRYNIGGDANIVKPYYKASKEYVWVLADNDDFSWNNWSQVEEEINKQCDAIIVADYEHPKLDIAHLFLQATFLPGVIYKTSNIDNTVMLNMEFNISNLFPHLALFAKIINENKNIAIIDNAIVLPGCNLDEQGNYSYIRGYEDGFVHPLKKEMTWICAYANSLWLIKDLKLRNYIISHNPNCIKLNSVEIFSYKDYSASGKNNLYNYLCVFAVLSVFDRIKFLINLILYFTIYKIIYISRRDMFNYEENKLVIRFNLVLFSFMKTKLFVITKKIKGVY